jgi:hypothetical protein
MRINKFREHVFIVPEDDAYRQVANGFIIHDQVDSRQIQILRSAGGWGKALDFVLQESQNIRSNPLSHVVLLIDFDGDTLRRDLPGEDPSRHCYSGVHRRCNG